MCDKCRFHYFNFIRHLWPCIIDVDSMGLRIGVHDILDVTFVLSAPLVQTNKWLGTPCNGCQGLWVDPG